MTKICTGYKIVLTASRQNDFIKMIFPNDSISVYAEQVGAGTGTLAPAGIKTILGVQSSQSGTASFSKIECGSNTIMKNYGKDFGFSAVSFVCEQPLTYSKTGNDSVSFIITYVPYNLVTQATSTAMTGGDILISTMLLFLLIFAITAALAKSLWQIQVWQRARL